MRRATTTAIAIAAVAALAAGPADARTLKPRIGTYVGVAPPAKLTIEVVKRGSKRQVRLLELEDGCVSQFIALPLSLGTVKGRSFSGQGTGVAGSTGGSIGITGTFTSRTRATAALKSQQATNPGVPTCTVTQRFKLEFLPDGL